jgi:hypothetical protein
VSHQHQAVDNDFTGQGSEDPHTKLGLNKGLIQLIGEKNGNLGDKDIDGEI